jgi:hypothetical protein
MARTARVEKRFVQFPIVVPGTIDDYRRLGYHLARFAIAACAISALSGCAAPMLISAGAMAGVYGQAAVGDSLARSTTNKQQRQRATAEAIGPHVDWFSVKVSGTSKHGNMIFWKAKTPEGRYACSEEPGDTVAGCTKLPDDGG